MKRAWAVWLLLVVLVSASAVRAQVGWSVPGGTPIGVHPAVEISSATAHDGDVVHFLVTRPVQIGGQTLVAFGADAFGTIVKAVHSKAFGRSGHLELTVDRVQATDGSWIPVHSRTSDTGANQTAIVAGAMVFVSVFGALIQGHEAVIPTDKEIDLVTTHDHPLMLNTAPQPIPAPGAVPGQGVVNTVAICQSVGPDGNPQGASTSFRAGSSLVVWYSVLPPPSNQQFEVRLYQGQSLLNTSQAPVMAGQNQAWTPLGGGLAPGAYRVDILLNGQVQASQTFTVLY